MFVTPIPYSHAKTGNELLADCTAGNESVEGQISFVLCAEYIAGVLDTWDYVGALSMAMAIDDEGEFDPTKVSFTPICTPDDVTKAQIIDIVVKHLESNPESRHEGAHKIILTAVANTFSCDLPR